MLHLLKSVLLEIKLFKPGKVTHLNYTDAFFYRAFFSDESHDFLLNVRKNELFKRNQRNLRKMLRKEKP